MSITGCVKKAGTALDAGDKAAIMAAARKYRADGLSADEAGKQAIRDQIAAVQALMDGPAEVAPVAAEVAAEPAKAKAAKIEDFGQKLEGARKDYAATMKDAESVDIAAEPLSKSWPEPDYQKLLDGGADPYMVAFVRSARDEVPTKPQKAWKLKGWVATVQELRNAATTLLSGKVSKDRVLELLSGDGFGALRRGVGSRAELYELAGHERSLKGITFGEHHYGLYKGQENVRKWVVEQKAKATMFSNWPRELAVGDTKAEMLDNFKAKLATMDTGPKAKGQAQFVVYRKRGQDGAWVGKKIGREYIDLHKTDDVTAARKYMQENAADLEKALEAYKQTPFERKTENQPRVGDDHRNGAPATPEVFAETFGFRGVQFGNYVEQGRRQSDLNQAFDGLMDMAAVLGIPPRAISLNGKLGLAFGARGKGGTNAPAAHYEPGNIVINLTKGSGPGSLAHEWWHSLDNYFGKESGAGGYGTGGVLGDKTRAEMKAAFNSVKLATQAKTLRQRAAELDKRKSKPYWDTPIELSARSFEMYVIAKLNDQGAANDYLANVVSKEFWDAQEALRAGMLTETKLSPTFPYPIGDEMPAVRASFDDFFKTVETRTDDAGNVAMFSRAPTAEKPDAWLYRFWGNRTWPSEADARDMMRRRLVDDNARYAGFFKPNDPSLVDGLVFVNAPKGQVRLKQPRAAPAPFARIGEPADSEGTDRPRVDWESRDLSDDGTAESVLQAYGRGHGNVYRAWVDPSLIPVPKGGGIVNGYPDMEGDYDWSELQRRGSPPPLKLRVGKNGKLVLIDGNHRLAWWREAGVSEVPAYVIDERPQAMDVLFDRAGTPSTANHARVTDVAETIAATWANAPEVVVVTDMQDPAVPQKVRDADATQRSQGADGVPAGFFSGGKVYLVSSQISSDEEAAKVLFHEALGHAGLRGVFGSALDKVLDQMAAMRPEPVRAKAKQYGLDFNKLSERRQAAEEVLAELAQDRPTSTWVQRAIAVIKAWLRENVAMFKDLGMSDAEVTAQFIEPARGFIERGMGNAGGADTMFSRTTGAATAGPGMAQRRNVQQIVRNTFADMVGNAGAKVSWWDKTLGTQYAKAEKFPAYKRVFTAVQQYLEDVSTMANEAAGQAKSILPKLETAKDLKNFGIKSADAKAIAIPIFTGTLDDKKVYGDDELRSRFNLTPAQIGQYREVFAAVNTSLDQVAVADVLRLIGDKNPALRELAITNRDAFRRGVEDYLTEQAAMGDDDASTMLDRVREKYDTIDKLKEEGYAPAMRFGRYKVHIFDPATNETKFFGLYESKPAANEMARDLAADPSFKGMAVERGVLSQEQYKLYSSMSLDSLELFAEAIGADQSEMAQEYIRLAKNNRSAMKRLLHRKGTAGFSQDVPRVLAAFITSNARMASGGMNMPTAKEAAADIRDGDVQDEAIKLVDSVQNPRETAGVFRGLMFMNFIGGSIASAAVNLTQPITMTLPYLSQWGGITKAGARLMSAGKMAASGKIGNATLRDALARAESDGIVSPQEIHHLTAQAMGTWGTNPWLQRAAFIWGSPFSLAEQFNRRVTFIAAYNTAREQGIDDPFNFAEKAVIETQGLYNKGNAPNWSRNAIGASALTFKQFSIHYLEWMGRMYRSGPEGKRAVLYALALLMLAAGADGLPGGDDLDDLIDTLGQALGYDTNSKRAKRNFIANTLGLGDLAADVFARGFSTMPGIPLDVSLRMSMGNLIPASGILLRSNTDRASSVLEVAGPAGGLAKQYLDAGQKALKGDVAGAAQTAAPVALQNVAKAASMWATGEARDTRDRKVMDTDAVDGLMKFLGFNPQSIARESEKMGMIRRSEQLAKNVEGEIAGQWARAFVDKDQEAIADAKQRLRDWNADNPQSRIVITGTQIMQRAKKLRQDRSARFITTVSPERRSAVKEEMLQ